MLEILNSTCNPFTLKELYLDGCDGVTDECLDYSDLNTVPPTVGGCVFDLGLGYCLDKELSDSSMGCASFVEDHRQSFLNTSRPARQKFEVLAFQLQQVHKTDRRQTNYIVTS